MLRTDSARYTVRYADPAYGVSIGYSLTNDGHHWLSSNYCRTPPSPILEKDMGGGYWAIAYTPVVLACKSETPFRIAPRQTYNAVLHVWAARPDAREVPRLRVDSIPGTYRLHWELRTGRDPDFAASPRTEIYSTPFRLAGPKAGED